MTSDKPQQVKCCENAEFTVTKNDTLLTTVYTCSKCGRRHIRMTAEPGRIGMHDQEKK